MNISEYDIVEPPTYGELDKILSSKRLGQVTLPLVIKMRHDELSARRFGNSSNSEQVEFVVTEVFHAGTPFLLGYVGTQEVQARLSVVQDNTVSDDERKLEFIATENVHTI